ncbi:DNA primase [Bacillus sp. FJAT-45350]|uniref:DNA primase n=1 Tax=Bacillus sp. FJAT-45350 TaxID=2011014 RepID=UPI000BB90432|nr:DNA primase [Bacillus sp. FJAT-45350]
MGSRISDEKIEKIRQSVDIVEVISDYVQLRKQGRQYVGLCPFHGEKSPSFSVSSEKQLYHCFGCGAGGNVYSFIMEIEGYTFIEAVKNLASRAKIDLPEVSDFEGRNKDDELTQMSEVHELISKFYHHILVNTEHGEVGRKYLEGRGFSKEQIETFQIGYAPDAWNSIQTFLEKRKYDLKKVEQAGLLSVREFDGKYFDRFRSRIMFPIWDSQGKPIAFGGRVIGDGKPKYLNSPESKIFNKSKTLYGVHLARPTIRKANEAVLFEGYVDVIAAWKADVKNGVATLGTSLTEEQAKLIRRNAETVVICYDPDSAGKSAAFRASSTLESVGCFVKVAILPDGLDPDDYIQKFGGNRFKTDVIGASLTLMAFKIRYLRQDRNLQDEGERIRYIEEVLTEISKLISSVERDHYLRQIAEEFSLSLDSLKQEQYRIFREQKKSKMGQQPTEKKPIAIQRQIQQKRLLPAFHMAERRLLAHMMRDIDLADTIQERIGGAFNIDEHHAIAAYLYAYYAEGNPPDPGRFVQRLPDQQIIKVASEIALIDVAELTEQELADYIRQVEDYPKWVEIEQREKDKRAAERQQDAVLAAQIAMEIIQMKRDLKQK